MFFWNWKTLISVNKAIRVQIWVLKCVAYTNEEYKISRILMLNFEY